MFDASSNTSNLLPYFNLVKYLKYANRVNTSFDITEMHKLLFCITMNLVEVAYNVFGPIIWNALSKAIREASSWQFKMLPGLLTISNVKKGLG